MIKKYYYILLEGLNLWNIVADPELTCVLLDNNQLSIKVYFLKKL